MFLSELLQQINSTTGSSLWTYFFILFQLHFTTREYKILQNICKDLPDIKVVKRAGRNAKTCNANKRLTYKNMQDYIMAQDNYEPLLASFILAKIESKCAPSPYAFVRDWFVKQFPNYQECKTFERNKVIPITKTAPQENEEKVS